MNSETLKKDNFSSIKGEILSRAKGRNACTEQYRRACRAETLAELMEVVKDNFHWCCKTATIDVELIERFRDDFADYDIYVNVDVQEGYLLCGNAVVAAYGNATVAACDSAVVAAYGNAVVAAYGNATVAACDSAKVRAYGNAKVRAYGNATVAACDSAKVEAYGNATVAACDSAKVEAYDNAYCISYSKIEFRLSGSAIYRVIETNTVYYANENINFVKQ